MEKTRGQHSRNFVPAVHGFGRLLVNKQLGDVR